MCVSRSSACASPGNAVPVAVRADTEWVAAAQNCLLRSHQFSIVQRVPGSIRYILKQMTLFEICLSTIEIEICLKTFRLRSGLGAKQTDQRTYKPAGVLRPSINKSKTEYDGSLQLIAAELRNYE